MKEYKNAIKCFKKCIETAWDINDISAELDAYGSLAIQHFLSGNLAKS